ncbi:MAG: hypothetical protein AAGF89_14355 [Bacteroidota bacterium]
MSSAITDTIRRILMEEEQVCLPGLGTLRLLPQPALISPIEGKALPPSEQVSFNSNLVLDDGRLLRELKETEVIPPATAAYELEEFLRNLRENLDAGRSVTLEGVGRFFKHFDGQLKFTAAGENFSKDSFGLPGLELKPIIRTEKQRRGAIEDPMLAGSGKATQPAPATAPTSRIGELLHHPELRRILWYVAAVLGVILALCLLYLLGQTIGSALAEDPKTPVARVEERPDPPATVAPAPAPSPVDARQVAPDEPPRLNDLETTRTTSTPVTPPSEPAVLTPAPTTPDAASTSGQNVSLIATGLYGSSRNVEKNLRRIQEAGYTPFSRAEGRYTRLGVRLEFQNEEEFFEALTAIRRRFSEDAFELERNGEKVPLQ